MGLAICEIYRKRARGLNAPGNLAAADFHGDGRVDLAASLSAGVALLGNLGDGGCGDARYFAVGGAIGRVSGGNFNGDGLLDFVAADQSSTSPPGELGVLLGMACP